MKPTVHHNIVLLLHQDFFEVVVIYSILVGLWGLFLWLRSSNPSGSFLGALVLLEGVEIVQAIIGGWLLLQGHRPADRLHYLYGLVSIIVVPAAWAYTARGTTRRDSLIMGLAALFLAGIAFRAAGTG